MLSAHDGIIIIMSHIHLFVFLFPPQIEKKNDVPKYLRGFQLEEEEQCNLIQGSSRFCADNPDYDTIDDKCKSISSEYTYGYCSEENTVDDDLTCCT